MALKVSSDGRRATNVTKGNGRRKMKDKSSHGNKGRKNSKVGKGDVPFNVLNVPPRDGKDGQGIS